MTPQEQKELDQATEKQKCSFCLKTGKPVGVVDTAIGAAYHKSCYDKIKAYEKEYRSYLRCSCITCEILIEDLNSNFRFKRFEAQQ